MMEVLGIYFPMAIACLREMVWSGMVNQNEVGGSIHGELFGIVFGCAIFLFKAPHSDNL